MATLPYGYDDEPDEDDSGETFDYATGLPSIPGTGVPGALLWLQEQIAASNTYQAVVAIGAPGVYEGSAVVVVGTDVRRRNEVLGMVGGGGPGYLAERIEIDVLCQGWTGDQDPTQALNIAWGLLNLVEQIARSDLTLGGNVDTSLPERTKGGSPEWADPEGRIVQITLTISALHQQ